MITKKVTLKYHPNRGIRERYEVVKLVGCVRLFVPLVAGDGIVRVGDWLNEDQAEGLRSQAEVTVIPE